MIQLGDALKLVVQPLIAIIFSISACIAMFVGKLNADQWLGLATVVITFYFAGKVAETAAANANKRAPNRATDVVISNVEGDMNVPGNQLPPSTRPTSTRRKGK